MNSKAIFTPHPKLLVVRTMTLVGIVLFAFNVALAQTTSIDHTRTYAKQVFASALGSSVRFSSLGELLQLRLQVVNSAGQTVFDSGFNTGNAVDWAPADGQSQSLPDDSYLCIVEVKAPSGDISKKIALLTLHDQSLALKQADASLFSSAQAHAAGDTAAEDISLTILDPAQPSPTAILAHDGNTARLASSRGGLSISAGDFFANKLLEQLRLTPEGNVGIGIANPRAKLEVAGRIKSSEGIIFP